MPHPTSPTFHPSRPNLRCLMAGRQYTERPRSLQKSWRRVEICREAMATMLHVRAPPAQAGSAAAAPAHTRGIGSPGAPAVTVAAPAPAPEAFIVGEPPAPPPRAAGSDSLVGRTLGSYVLLSVLGEGGMGRVY